MGEENTKRVRSESSRLKQRETNKAKRERFLPEKEASKRVIRAARLQAKANLSKKIKEFKGWLEEEIEKEVAPVKAAEKKRLEEVKAEIELALNPKAAEAIALRRWREEEKKRKAKRMEAFRRDKEEAEARKAKILEEVRKELALENGEAEDETSSEQEEYQAAE